jgi:hypothetical protein
MDEEPTVVQKKGYKYMIKWTRGQRGLLGYEIEVNSDDKELVKKESDDLLDKCDTKRVERLATYKIEADNKKRLEE